MTLYKEEKKRIGSLRWGIVCGILFVFLILLQGQMMEIHQLEKYGKPAKPIIYNLKFLYFGVMILIGYLNSRLFYVKERGKSVYLIKKYEIVPVSTKRLYQVKIRIMAETVLVLMIGSILLYFFIAAANKQLMIDPNLVKSVLFLIIFSGVFMIVIILVMDVYQEYRLQKQ